MRFGRTLDKAVYPPWREGYIDYPKLKKLLKDEDSAQASPTDEQPAEWTDEDQTAFVHELTGVQLPKVAAFHKQKLDDLDGRIAKCEAQLDDIAVADEQVNSGQSNGDGDANGSGKKPVPSEQEKQKILKDTLSELDAITKDINRLEKFARINYTGFLKAVKKHDRKRGEGYKVRALLNVHLNRSPFHREDYSVLLQRLSGLYSFVRQHLEEKDRQGTTVSEPRDGKDEYTSRKFLVHPDNLLELKTTILRRLPVLVYNPQTSKIAEGTQTDPSITSIYFDNPQFALYTKKMEQEEATSLRLRWYGQLNNKPQLFVEKKTVLEDGSSHDDRLTTKEKYIQGFLNGEYSMDKQISKLAARAGEDSQEVKDLKEATTEIQQFIKEENIQPVLRANYTRTAFQLPGDDRVRISLDTNLAFIREDALDRVRPCRDPDSWHRTDIDDNELSFPFNSIRKGEISRYEYAVLEIKIRNEAKKSEWIEDLMHSHLIKEIPKFSKFVHGIAVLFDDNVNTLPFWLSEREEDIRREPVKAWEDEQDKRQKQRDADFAVGSLLKSAPSRNSLARSSQRDVISPVGSPSQRPTVSTSDKRPSQFAKMAATEDAQQEATTGEADEDETGEHTHANYGTLGANTSTGAKWKNIFLPASTSKYAQHRHARLPPGVSKPDFWIKDQGPVKVEAKVWLANQRTFIKWQHVSVLLASLSLGLYNAAGEGNAVARTLGIVYTIVAVFAAAWGYGVYVWRSRLIEGRSGRDFDAVTGPVVVCVGLIVALVLNFGFKVRLSFFPLSFLSSSFSFTRVGWIMFGSTNVCGNSIMPSSSSASGKTGRVCWRASSRSTGPLLPRRSCTPRS